MAQKPTRLKRGDTSPVFDAVLRDAAGDAIDIQAGDAATLFMRFATPPRASKISAGAMVIVLTGAPVDDPDRGRVRYAWTAGDTDTPGKFDLEVRLIRSGGTPIERFPNSGQHRLVIEDEIA